MLRSSGVTDGLALGREQIVRPANLSPHGANDRNSHQVKLLGLRRAHCDAADDACLYDAAL
jgi:hypothetical protein